jgi:PDZ domain-containing secreted protein
MKKTDRNTGPVTITRKELRVEKCVGISSKENGTCQMKMHQKGGNNMKKIFLLGLLLIFVLGCVQHNWMRSNYMQLYAFKDGVTEYQFIKDDYECAQQLYKMCMEAKGYIVADEKVGVTGIKVSEELTITRVVSNSPAEKAGIKVGDKVKSVSGIQVKSKQEYYEKVLLLKVGEKRTYVFERDGREFTVDMVGEPASKFVGK